MSWKKEDIFFNSQELFDQFLKDCEKAQSSIWIEVFSLEEGKLYQKLIPALNAAASRGVDVRIIVDGLGSLETRKTKLLDKHSQIQYRIFNPFFISRLFLVNHRDHRKLFLIDQKIAYVGSANIDDKSYHWRESTVRLTGNNVQFLVEAFYRNWIRVGKDHNLLNHLTEKVKRFVNYPFKFKRLLRHRIILTDSAFDRIKVKLFWASKIDRARTKIWITTPYFVPTALIFNSLLKAAKKGIDVRIIIPGKNHIDLPFMKKIERYYIETLLKHGVKVYEYLPKMIHAKVCLFDHQVIMGSSNWNHRSRYSDLELDVILGQKESYESIKAQFEIDASESHLMTINNIPRLNIFQSVYYKFFHFIRYWT